MGIREGVMSKLSTYTPLALIAAAAFSCGAAQAQQFAFITPPQPAQTVPQAAAPQAPRHPGRPHRPQQEDDRKRSVTLAMLAPLARSGADSLVAGAAARR